jgi:hypothetical protein
LGFLTKLTSETDKKGIIININDYEDEKAVAVKDTIIEYLGINAMIIISSTGLTILPADFREEKILDYYQEYKSGNGYYLTDTDDDGLENFKEIDFRSGLIDFTQENFLPTVQECVDHLTFTGKYTYVEAGYDAFVNDLKEKYSSEECDLYLYDLIMSVRILPINSDPTAKDGDEDGYSDYDEILIYDSNPLICDVVEYSLKNDYVKITGTPTIRGVVNSGYGGNQAWFEKEGDVQSIQLVKGGCGVTAFCDALLYLRKNHRDINTVNIPVSDEIEWTSYEEFVRSAAYYYVKPVSAHPWFSRGTYTYGLNLAMVANGLRNYMSGHFLKYSISEKLAFSYNKMEYENDIVSQLKSDMPSIVLYGYEPNPDLEYTYIGGENDGDTREIKGPHFMVITGIKIDKISGKTDMILASWSYKIKIDMDEYLSNIGLLGGFIYIE